MMINQRDSEVPFLIEGMFFSAQNEISPQKGKILLKFDDEALSKEMLHSAGSDNLKNPIGLLF